MMDAVAAGDAAGGFAAGEGIEGCLALLGIEGGAAPEGFSLGLGNPATFGGTAHNAVAFVFGQNVNRRATLTPSWG